MLQSRQKWQLSRPNLKEGHIVLLKDKQLKRNEWLTGIIVKALPSKDGVVRKLEVKITHKTKKDFPETSFRVYPSLISRRIDYVNLLLWHF